YVLTGLRVARGAAGPLFEGVGLVEESSTYQLILEKGDGKAAKKVVLLLGGKRLGPPETATQHTLGGITDLERLDRMVERLSEEKEAGFTWQDLLATP